MHTVRIRGVTALTGTLFQNPDDPIPAGTELLGRYSVVRTLGKGGMGIVVAARHCGLGELHAIKFLLPGALVHPQAVQRFEREARAAARLRSEHVARVMDIGRMDSGEPFMVMEYLDGRDFRRVLQDGPLSCENAIEFLLQVCDAVAEAHRAGIVHRDLKPANLFLTTRPNGSPCVKVLDFGIAKIADPSEADLTHDGMIGSLKYMAPEQILRSRTADWRADIWALGMILYEFVTARTPFAATSQVDQIANIMEDEPEPPSVVRVDLPSALETVILKCLRKTREERFQSVQELADALRDVAGRPQVHATPIPITVETTQPFVPEERTQRGFGVTERPPPAPPSLRKPLVVGGTIAALGSMLVLVASLPRTSEPTLATPSPASAAQQETKTVVPPGPTMVAEAASAPSVVATAEASATAEEIVAAPTIGNANVGADKRRVEKRGSDAGAPLAAASSSSALVAPSGETLKEQAPAAMDVPAKPEAMEEKKDTKSDRGENLAFD